MKIFFSFSSPSIKCYYFNLSIKCHTVQEIIDIIFTNFFLENENLVNLIQLMVVIFLYYQLLIHKRNFRLVHE